MALPSGNIIVSSLYSTPRVQRVLKLSIDNDIGCFPLSDKFYVIDSESMAVRYSSSLELQTIRARINVNIENLGMDFVVRGNNSTNLHSIPEDVSHA